MSADMGSWILLAISKKIHNIHMYTYIFGAETANYTIGLLIFIISKQLHCLANG